MELIQLKIPDSQEPEADQSEYGFFLENGKYYFRESKNNTSHNIQLSNFVMESLFHLVNGSNNTQRIIFLQRSSGETNIIEVYSSEMKPESFETILKSKRCTFFGSAYQLKKVFARMMDMEDEAFILQEMGWNAEHHVYVFADAVHNERNKVIKIDEVGIIADEDKKYYLPAFGFANLNNEDFKTEKKYKFNSGTIDFQRWAQLYFEAFGNNGLIGILFLILSLFRDIVFDRVGFFPFLFLFGDFGTGKTSFTERLLSLFGRDTIGTPLNNATTIALSRLTSSRTNGIFYFKEYTNETDSTAEDFILTAYDGAGRTTGIKSNDNRTKSLPVKSAMIFDGNHLPTAKSAILSRMILLNFEDKCFSSKQNESFNLLKTFSLDGFGNVLVEILSCRDVFSDNFKSAFTETTAKFKNEGLNLPERSINHMALLYTAFESLNRKIIFPFNTDQAREVINKVAEDQNELLKESSNINIFWTSINIQIKRGYIQGYSPGLNNEKTAHFRLKIVSESDYILQIKFSSVYPFYTRYCKDNNLRLLDSSSLKMLLTSTANSNFLPTSQKSRNIAYTDKLFGSCYQFMLTVKEGIYLIGENEISV